MTHAGERAKVYRGLAEALAAPGAHGLPGWLSGPGVQWPVFEAAAALAHALHDPAWTRAVEALAEVRATSLSAHMKAYRSLFVGSGRPAIWLYESQHVDGRLPGPATFQVKKLYVQAGLTSAGAELPDHASVELAFLAFLSEMDARNPAHGGEWREVRSLFIKKHAGRWLPAAARQLMNGSHPAWAAIGSLLSASLLPDHRPGRAEPNERPDGLPQIPQPEDCTLCGFCVQICPTQALAIREDEHATGLWLLPVRCVRCEKCVRVCTENAVRLTGAYPSGTPVALRESQRAACSRCGEPTVSQAELQAVASQIGHPAWLDYCLNCR